MSVSEAVRTADATTANAGAGANDPSVVGANGANGPVVNGKKRVWKPAHVYWPQQR